MLCFIHFFAVIIAKISVYLETKMVRNNVIGLSYTRVEVFGQIFVQNAVNTLNFCKKCGDCGECGEKKYLAAFHRFSYKN